MQIKNTLNGHCWFLSNYWKNVRPYATQLKTISLVRAEGGAYVKKMQSKANCGCFPHHLLGNHVCSPLNSFP